MPEQSHFRGFCLCLNSHILEDSVQAETVTF